MEQSHLPAQHFLVAGETQCHSVLVAELSFYTVLILDDRHTYITEHSSDLFPFFIQMYIYMQTGPYASTDPDRRLTSCWGKDFDVRLYTEWT